MNRVLVIGASGLVGSQLAMALRDDCCVYGTFNSRHYPIRGVPMIHVDLLKERALFDAVLTIRPTVVFYCAAIRDEKACTENALQALTVNAEVAADIALCLRPLEGRLIYFSSSKVFSGQKGDYTEEDTPDPSTSYGAAKLRGESLLADFENTFVLRLGTLFGFGPDRSRGLIPRLLAQLWDGRQASFINDEYRTFQSVHDVVEAARRLMHCEREQAGVYHCPGGFKATYFEFARSLARILAHPKAAELIHPVAGDSFVSPYNTPELRGRDTSLNAGRFSRNLGFVGSDLEKSLESIKNQLLTGRI